MNKGARKTTPADDSLNNGTQENIDTEEPVPSTSNLQLSPKSKKRGRPKGSIKQSAIGLSLKRRRLQTVVPFRQLNPTSRDKLLLDNPENFVKFHLVFQKLDHLTCNGILRISRNEIIGFIHVIQGRHK